MTITYPLLVVVDDSGAIVTGATVTISSVTDKAGSAIPTPGLTLNLGADPFVSADYDAEAHGEAVLTLAISKSGPTITGLNAAPRFYLAKDSGRILAALPAATPGSAGGLLTLGSGAGQIAASSGAVPTTGSGASVDAIAAGVWMYVCEAAGTGTSSLSMGGAIQVIVAAAAGYGTGFDTGHPVLYAATSGTTTAGSVAAQQKRIKFDGTTNSGNRPTAIVTPSI